MVLLLLFICIIIIIIIIIIQQSPAGQRKRGNGFWEPPCILEPLFFSALHDSKNPGFVLWPLSPYAIASLGVARRGSRLFFDQESELQPYYHANIKNMTNKLRTLTWETNREFTKGGLVKGGLAIRYVFNLRITNGT